MGFCNSAKRDETEIWRREWDSNPRYGFPYTRFPSVRLQPLVHHSTSDASQGRWPFDGPHAGAQTPAATSCERSSGHRRPAIERRCAPRYAGPFPPGRPMIRFVFRFVGLLILAGGFIALIYDGTKS